MVYSASAVC